MVGGERRVNLQSASSYNAIMRAVQVHLTAEELARRRATGIDRWDEMWEGVLHMTPALRLRSIAGKLRRGLAEAAHTA